MNLVGFFKKFLLDEILLFLPVFSFLLSALTALITRTVPVVGVQSLVICFIIGLILSKQKMTPRVLSPDSFAKEQAI
jgi:uncharacterized membrane protein